MKRNSLIIDKDSLQTFIWNASYHLQAMNLKICWKNVIKIFIWLVLLIIDNTQRLLFSQKLIRIMDRFGLMQTGEFAVIILPIPYVGTDWQNTAACTSQFMFAQCEPNCPPLQKKLTSIFVKQWMMIVHYFTGCTKTKSTKHIVMWWQLARRQSFRVPNWHNWKIGFET